MAGYSYRLPRKYHYRPRGKSRYRLHGRSDSKGPLVAVAAVAALVAASGAKASAHHGGATTDSIVIPDGGSLGAPDGWASALLAADRLPRTSCNLSAVEAWERAEGGGFGNQAAFNPLNVNPGAGAGWPGGPAIGAWAFPDATTGLRYTVQTLNNGDYGGILSALRSGGSAQAVCDAIMASPWAASHYDGNLTASC